MLTMNPVIGDEALETLGGKGASTRMTEVEKVQCHLSYAHQQLLLQSESPPNHRRKQLLDTFESYIDKGEFPSNEKDPAERYPCFVDSLGTLCAVAHLMHKTGASELVEAIAATHKHDTIAQIGTDATLLPEIQTWASSNGITLQELALIQPTYKFSAREAREAFAIVESQINTIVAEASSSTSADACTADEMEKLQDSIQNFRRNYYSGFGWWPERDSHAYQKKLKKLAKKIHVGVVPGLEEQIGDLYAFVGGDEVLAFGGGHGWWW